MEIETYIQELFSSQKNFEKQSTSLWEYQFHHNPVIRDFVEKLGWPPPVSIPIEFFKAREMKAGKWDAEAIFESSGTTGQVPSRHFIRDLSLYERNVLHGFHHFFEEKAYRILALLPSYLERGNSSLVHMVKTWIEAFGLPGSGFYLDNFGELRKAIFEAADAGEPIILIGVAFALWDFVEEEAISLPGDAIVIETGGMKGRKEELIRSDLHKILKEGLGISHIYSEYGMTEMMSQAYLLKDGRFHPAPTLKVWTSDIHLNKLIQPPGITGRIHLVDLANIHSCGFIATDDLGKVYEDGTFDVLGRLDTSEVRGCNLMYL